VFTGFKSLSGDQQRLLSVPGLVDVSAYSNRDGGVTFVLIGLRQLRGQATVSTPQGSELQHVVLGANATELSGLGRSMQATVQLLSSSGEVVTLTLSGEEETAFGQALVGAS
jgi:hypothetical protein